MEPIHYVGLGIVLTWFIVGEVRKSRKKAKAATAHGVIVMTPSAITHKFSHGQIAKGWIIAIVAANLLGVAAWYANKIIITSQMAETATAAFAFMGISIGYMLITGYCAGAFFPKGYAEQAKSIKLGLLRFIGWLGAILFSISYLGWMLIIFVSSWSWLTDLS
jgi:hypothetical protein|tara:strand:- start:807 stop:1295 length:489 start_codon:yes stop_codon:yes gene_type:complete